MSNTKIKILSIDHIVLVVANPVETCAFYQKILGLQPTQDSSGRWSLKFGQNRISLQSLGKVPEIARRTTRGSANFCLITDTPLQEVIAHLKASDVKIVAGPSVKEGGVGPIMSIYFYDIDGNLVEVSNRLGEDG